MKNIKEVNFFNITHCKDNNIKLIQTKMPNNKDIKDYSYENNNKTLIKFHRPLSTTINSNNFKDFKKKKTNEILKQKIYNNININKVKTNNIHALNINHILEAFNSKTTYKLVNIHQKINGKNLEEFILKNIISLPKINNEKKNIFGKNSISVFNYSQNKNNNKNLYYPNFIVENGNKFNNINNIIILSNEPNTRQLKYFSYRNNNDKANEERRKAIIKNQNILKKNSFENNNIYIQRDNRYNNAFNSILLKTTTNYKLPNTSLNVNNNSLLHSYPQHSNPSLENKNKNQYINNNNLLNSKENENIKNEKNKIIKSNIYEVTNYNNNKIINNDINNNYFLKEEFLEKLNSVRKLYKEREIERHNLKCFYYLILPGNASYLVEKCMNHRINWVKPFSVVSTLYNFKWQELSYGIDYASLGHFQNVKQIVNHYENHFAISNKAKMFINLFNYCEKRKLSVFKYVPFTIIFELKDEKQKDYEKSKINSSIIKNKNENEKENEKNNKYEKLKNFINKIDNFIIHYNDIGNYYYKEDYKKYKKSKENNKNKNKNKNLKDIKKFPSKRKYRLFRKFNKRKYLSYTSEYKKNSESELENEENNYTFYSDFFNNLIEDNNIPIYDKNKERKFEEENNLKTINKCGDKIIENNLIGENTLIEIPESHFSGKNMWVVKAINLNRGMCIRIVNSYEQMLKIINKFKVGVDYDFTKEKIEENEINSQIKNNNNNNKTSPTKNPKNNNINDNNDKQLIKNKINFNNLNSSDKKNNIKTNNLNSTDKNLNNNVENINENKNEEDKKINEKEEKLYNCNKIIIQKYIENPLLYKGRKCDMRIWVLLTHSMKVYVFKEGHLKTCSIEYNINSKDAFSHITNYSFQKYNSNFQKYEKGNEVPFYEFQKYLDEKYSEKNYNIKTNLLVQIKEIVKITMRSAKDKINKNHRNYQFEIFGYDFMMDKDFNLFLIEINTNPGLEESSPWIQLIVPRMLDDALRLTIDQIFETKYDFNVIRKNRTKEDINNYKILLNNYNNKIDINGKNVSSSLNIKSAIYKANSRNNDNDNNINSHLNTNPNSLSIENYDFKKKENDDDNKKDKKGIDENNKNKENINKNKKYISPFPVPGYTLYENIWDFVCDLNEQDPLDLQIDKKQEEEISTENNKRYNHYKLKRKKNKKGKKKK